MYQMMLPSWWRALPPTRWGPEIFTFSHRPRCSRTPWRPELGLQKMWAARAQAWKGREEEAQPLRRSARQALSSPGQGHIKDPAFDH